MWDINCDESYIEPEHDFMVIGGIAAKREDMLAMSAAIDKWRGVPLANREFKWNKSGRGKRRTYRQFVTGAMRWILDEKKVVFAAAAFPRAQIDTDTFFDGNEDRQLYSFMYLPIVHQLIPHIPEGEAVSVYPDKRNLTNYSLKRLHRELNNGIGSQHGYPRNQVVTVEPVDSKVSNAGQVVDVLTGAVGFHFNRRDTLPGTCQRKIDLAAHVAALAKMPNLRRQTTRRVRFAIWQVNFGSSANKSAPKST